MARPGVMKLDRAPADGAQEILGHLAGAGQFLRDGQIPEIRIEVDVMREAIMQKLHLLLTAGEFGALRQERHKCDGELGGRLLLRGRQSRIQRRNVAIGVVVMR